MTVTMDLGLDEAYRHEAETHMVLTQEATGEMSEHIIVRCECGEEWESNFWPVGTYDDDEEDGYLAMWQCHVRIMVADRHGEEALAKAEQRNQ